MTCIHQDLELFMKLKDHLIMEEWHKTLKNKDKIYIVMI